MAVVGATGAAGTELLRVLERRSFPVASLRPIGSARSVGKSVQFCGESIPVEKLNGGSFEKIDIAFFSAGGDVSRTFVPIACQADAIVIDKSSAFRMDPHVPLVIPEINAEDVTKGFLPAPALVTAYVEPSGPGVRVDSGVEAGREVSGAYDPMIAKLIVHGVDREHARRRMLRALDEFVIEGPKTLIGSPSAILRTNSGVTRSMRSRSLSNRP